MGLRLGAFTACFLALAGPAAAAEVSRVASAAEPGDPFDLDVTIRWDRVQQRGKITRERATPVSGTEPFGAVVDADELRYTRVKNQIVSRIAVGLYRDLELHVEVPYVLADDHLWRYATVGGLPVEASSGIATNGVDAMNQPCAVSPCPLFPVSPSTTVYHGGKAGDVMVGLSWGIFNDEKDDTKPFWLVGADVTLPTATRYDPAVGRAASWQSPHVRAGNPGAFGEKIWKYDLYTVLSRRLGPIDPYFKAHATAMTHSNGTYSNCEHAPELAALSPAQATLAGAANCADARWDEDAAARLPWIAGLLFGAEIVPYENRAEEQKVTIDLRAWADYTSSARFYNPLTDATGKLHETEGYLTAGGLLGFYLRASRFVSLHASASLATQTAHFLTGESLGRDGVEAGDITGATANDALNPNYDWRYDAPGRRFRLSETGVFAFSVAGVLQF
jgi:hypothetical protein